VSDSHQARFPEREKTRQLVSALLRKKGINVPEKEKLLPRPVFSPSPASFAQERLWLLEQMAPGSRYNMQFALRLKGEINFQSLNHAWREMVSRHEILRTTFKLLDDKIMQFISPDQNSSLTLVDVSASGPVERESQVQQLLAKDAQENFDLANGPLVRPLVLRLGEKDFILSLTMHHIIADGWSMAVLVRELTELYAAFSEDRPHRLPPLAIQYADFAWWQRQRLSGEFLEKQLGYWKRQLGNAPILDLPIDHARPQKEKFLGAHCNFQVSREIAEGLRELARREHASLFMTLLAAWQVLLHRYTGQSDVLVGAPIANRTHVEIESLIGFFVNTLVLRTEINSHSNFKETLSRIRKTTLDAYEHQDVPYEKLVAELQPERAAGGNPLLATVLNWVNMPESGPEFAGIQYEFVQSVPLENPTAKFDLSLNMIERTGALPASFEYSTELFEPATIARMSAHFQNLLAGIVINPDQPVGELPILKDEERRQVLWEWNRTGREYPACGTVLALLEAQAEKTPDHPAVVFAGISLSYRQLHARANQLAHFLKRRGVGPEVVVGVCMERSAQLVIALLGAMKAGGAYLPLDPGYPAERLNYMLEDAKPAVVLVGKAEHEKLAPLQDAARLVCLEEEDEAIGREPREAVASGVQEENLAYVIYTSGSTGRPKGVMNVHRGLLNRLQWMQEAYGLKEQDRVLQKTPFGFDVSVWEFFWPLMYGAVLVVARPEGHKDSGYLAATIQQERITTVHFVPSLLGVFLQEPEVEKCVSLKRVISSGEALPAALVKSFRQRLQGAELHNLYGPTEASIDVSSWACQGEQAETARVPIGHGIANTELYVLDTGMEPAPVEVTGELYIGGMGLARGYWRRAELTAEKFIPDRFSGRAGERLYRTGDLARWRGDGELDYVGRMDHQVKLRGFRIELGEIEAVLCQHEAVQQAVVVVQEERSGKQLIAYVVPAAAGALPAEALRSYAQEKLPDYMVPSGIVKLEALPLTGNGKLDRKALPRWEGRGEESGYQAPRTPGEELLAGIWSEVLGLERIGIHDNFFALGGHSLLAAQVTSRVREIFLIDLPLRVIFEAPTIAGLSQKIDHAKSGGAPSISIPTLPAERRVHPPLSFAQERMWFLHQVASDKSVYNILEGVRLSGPLDVAALDAGFQEIIRRHEILRTSFTPVEGQCEPKIAAAPAWRLTILDLEKTKSAAEVLSVVREETRKPFDLVRAPLLRATLLKSAEDEHVLLLAMHHIVSDGWSFGVLLRELKELYRAHARKEAPAIHELQIQYADYAEWQRQRFAGKALDSQLAYWKRELAGASPELLLPTDHPRPAVQSFHGQRYGFELPESLTGRLKEFSLQQGVTLFMTLLAGLKVLLARYTGQRDLLVGTVAAGRDHREIEGLIGLFANTLALRTNVTPTLSVADFLKRVREVCINAYLHQEAPFEKVVAHVEPERDLSRSPIFQVMFAWQIPVLEDWQMEGLRLARLPVEMESETAKFDLSFIVGENRGRLLGVIEYSAGLFEVRTISRLCAHFCRVLEGMAQHGGQPVCEISLLSEAERQQIVLEWNKTAREFQQGRTVVQMIEQQARLQPEAPAVRDQKRGLTYRELNQLANQWAHYLRKLGVQAESRAAVCMERSSEMVAAQLGVMKAGGAFIALDHEHPAERLQYQINDSGAKVVIAGRSSRDKLRGLEHAGLVCIEGELETVKRESIRDPEWSAEKEQLAYVIYTSGSTGKPKGVEIEHRGLMNLVLWHQQAYGTGPGERGSQIAAAGFDASIWEIWPCLAAGASLEIAGEDRGPAEKLQEWLMVKGITTAFLPTPLAEAVMRLGEWKPSELKRILTGGDRLRERPPQSWDLDVVNHYGPTECTVVATAATVEKRGEGWPTIGKPISNARVYVLDEEWQPAPVGIAGELYVGGAGLARGYAGKADLTAERFVPDPISGKPGERLYRTGDQCRWNEAGELEFVGRKDQQVKVRGHRIETGEIEAILKEHQTVREALVTVQEKQGGEKFLIAYLVTAGKNLETSELREYLQSRLPSYMVPSAFMQLESLPLTASGKLDRRALKKWEFISTGDQREPQTRTEILLAEIWKQLLRLERVGIHDSFFELGGDSILGLQVVARARQQGIRITHRQLFESPTIAALAAVAGRISEGVTEGLETGAGEEEAALIYPLSPMQQGMLFECISAPESGAYVQQLFCTLRGPLELTAFESAWQKVIERHPVLRTLFTWDRGEKPLQVVRERVSLPFEVQDWTGLPDPEQEKRWLSLLERDRHRGFAFAEPPLLRIHMLQTAPNVYRLLFSFHHLILDGWSLPLLFKEVFETYKGETDAGHFAPARVRPYHDYVRWLQKQDVAGAEEYWRQTLRGFSAPTRVEIHSPGRANQAGEIYFEQQIQFLPEETARLQSVAKQHGLTLSVLVQAAWALLISRYSSQEDVIFGLTVSGRSAGLTGIESMIGLFINTLPVRTQVQPEQQLSLWLKELQARQTELSEYEHSPLAQVQKWSDVPAGTRLFESIVIFENYPLDSALLRGNYGFTVEDVQSVEVTNYPLTVTAIPRSDLRLIISYDRRLFDDNAMARMLGHMRTVLLNLAAVPQQRIREVPWITQTERSQLLVDWNQTATEGLPEQCVQAMFEEQVRRTPEAIAVTFDGCRMTYAELDRRANQLANHLRRLGVTQETYAGLCIERSLEMVVGILGILKAGGVYAPLEPSWPTQRKSHVLTQTHARVLLTSKRLRAGIGAFAGHVVCLDSDWERVSREQVCCPNVEMDPDSLAYVIYTSGTTGKPKGVMVSHRALCNHLRWMQAAFPLTPQDRVPQKYSLSFDVSVLEIFYPLLAGARLVMVPPTEYFDSASLMDFLIENKITAIDLVPSMLHALVQDQRFSSLATLRQITCGGDVLSRELQAQAVSATTARLANLYGPTEATISSTFWNCPDGESRPPVSIGRPISNTGVYILDRNNEPVPVGVAGEICIGGIGLARGYLDEPALTARKFVPNCFSHVPGERLYRTGDLGCYREDGNVDYLGRVDDQVKVRGFRVEPGEIEAVLRAHPAVREAAVLAHEQQLVAYVAGAEPEQDDLRQHLKEHLPEYMVPAHFVWLNQIPRLPSGKVDRTALPLPTSENAVRTKGYTAPRNTMEETLAAIWSAVLKLARVGVEDNFFELGGDSILSLQVVAQARQQGIRITPRQLFESPTIGGLAAVAGTMGGGNKESAEAEIVQGEVALTPIQRWFFEQGFAESHHYNQALALRAGEELNGEWLAAAWRKLVEHHDALRLRYRREGGEWLQWNAAREENEFFSVVELKGESAEEKRRELKKITEGLQKSLDLERGPLLRVAQVKDEGTLVMVVHHLAVDGVSWRILLEDLESAYRQASMGKEIRLPAKTSSYQRWAEELKQGAETRRYEDELEYWLKSEREALEEMPRDQEGGENQESERERVKVELGTEETRQLLQEAPGAYHTQINEVLLTAVMGAWEKWTGKRRMLIDVEGHGREIEGMDGMDVSRTVGWFTAVYPVRLEMGKREDIGERLKGIKEQLRRVPKRGAGYGVLRYISKDKEVVERLKNQAAAEISFNYLGQVDGVLAQAGTFRQAEVLEESSRGERNRRNHLLEVEARVEGGRLRVEWNYSRAVHRRATIEAIAWNFVEELEAIVRHCVSPGAGGFTPSDFPLANLGQNTLDLLVKDHRAISDVYPLSPIQQGLLFHTLYEPARSGTYVEQLSCTLEGSVDQRFFEQAWQEVIDGHPILRTSFAWEGLQEPLQIVHRSARATFIQHDWRQLAGGQGRRLEELRRADVEQGFNLDSPPLMRFVLVQLADERFEFLWSSHHLLLDGWSMSLVLKEVLERYAAACAGKAFHPSPHRPYRDYVAWIRSHEPAKAKEYWEAMLKGFSGAVPLPGERAVQSFTANKTYGEQQLTVSAETTLFLQAKVRQHRITLNALVQAAWALLLRHYTGERDVLFGVTVSGRPAELAGMNGMVGIFINTLPLRIGLSPEATLASVLNELQTRQLHLDERAYSSLSSIQEWSEVPAGRPLFETVLVFENYPVDASLKEPRGELKFSNVRSWASTNYPLTLIIKPGPRLVLQLTYETRRYERSMIVQLLAHLQNLLLGAATDPMAPVGSVQPLSEAERQQLLAAWNNTAKEYPHQGIPQLFEQQARLAPQKIAALFQDQGLRYEELNRRANQLAHYLEKQGVQPETRVGVCLERSLEMVAALLGILKAGGAYVALDAESPSERLAVMLKESQARLVLTQQRLLERLPDGMPVQVVCVDEKWDEIARESTSDPKMQVSGDHLAYVSYTSGSTGKPKGVSVPHRAVVRLVRDNDYARLGADEVFLQLAPLAFDASTFEIWGALLNGGRLAVMAPGPQSAEEIGQALRKYGVTTLWLTAGLFHIMVDEELEKLKQVRQVLAGGDVLSVVHVNRYLAQMNEGALLINGYGPTENTTFTCCHTMKKGESVEGTVPVGRPIGNTQVYVLNEDMQPVAVGAMGELYAGGEGLARGYENDPTLTAEKFVPHPYGAGGERLYRTGDQVRWRQDGVLEFVRRADRQVKIRGFRIEPGEIESVLAQHEKIREAVVAVHEKQGGEKTLVAYLVMRPEQELSIPDLQKHLQRRLPDYMRPGIFVPLDKIPLTTNGKVDYKALPQPEAAGALRSLVLPRTPLEHAVVEIWRQVFGVEQISIEDNFFDLGGHSLRALQITSRVRTVLGAALPLRSVFEEPTVSEQVRTIERLLASGEPASAGEIPPFTRTESAPLSFGQQRLWFLHQLEPASDFYNVPLAFHVRGPLNTGVLADCWSEIARRHEVLRTTFPIRQGVPVQEVGETWSRSRMNVTELGHLPAEQAAAAAEEFLSKEAREPFDLSCGPLMRVFLLRLAKEEHALLLNVHHIIVDGWSLGILLRELAVLYEAFLAGRSSPLPPLPIQYADYAQWQRERLNGEFLKGQLAYWRQQLAGDSALELPTDYPRPKVQTFRGANRTAILSSKLLESLKELARRENATLFMTLLAAIKVLLYRYTGQPEITVGTPVAGRIREQTEPLIGFFVNTLALRTRVPGHPRFTEFLRQVRAVSLGAYAHQDIPFEKLVEELQPERDSGRSPFFQVMFAFEDTLPWDWQLAGLQVSPIEIENRTAQFDLTFTMGETLNELRLSCQYNSDLFQGATIERMMRHFELLVRGIVADAKQPVSEVPLLSDEERRQVLWEWNRTGREYPACGTVLALLEAQAEKTPDHPAVVFAGISLSYRQLHEGANQLAHFLKRRGVGPEVVVGVCMERSAQLVIALLAAMKAGGAYLPLDPGYPAERLGYMLEDAKPAVVLVGKAEHEKLAALQGAARLVCVEKEDEAIGREPREAVASGVQEENLAYVIYTSGSTGRPKGVMNVHRGLLNRLQWMQEAYRLKQQDRVLQKTPFGFDVSVWEFFWPLMYGAVLVVARPEGHKDSGYLAATIQQERITTVHFVPSLLGVFLQEPEVEKCVSLKRVISSGEALPAALVKSFRQRLQGAELHNLYGPTEASIDVSFWACQGEQAETARVPIGHGIANTELYVLDAGMEPSPVGVAGELYIGGMGLARGYWRRAELTAEKFIPDGFSGRAGERLYRTGDLARWRGDGELEYVGRMDHQVKLRGFRIELGEIEAVLSQHEAVQQAVVVVRQDASEDKRLIGYVVAKNEADGAFRNNVRDYLRTKLPEYMVPAIVQVNEIPLTVNGKIDYNSLPAISSCGFAAANAYVAPRNVIEQQIERACCDLLSIQRMSVDDNFFDLGGHSLLAMRLMTWLRDTFQVEGMPLRGFFETPTIAGLAALTVRHEAHPGQTEKIARFLQHLNDMSPEEVMTFRAKHMENAAAQNAVSKQ
jgi:amino acid adenylation domain-containing protein/non-ribosomal peptide synthase protein (TIGR01720 family)